MGHKKDKTEYEIIDVPTTLSVQTPVENGHSEEDFVSAGIVTFKKTIRGFNPKEVNEYIEVLSANLSGAQQVFEAQSAELKSSLALISRERDNLKVELASMAGKAEAYEQKNAECEENVRELAAVKVDNAQLQERVNSLFSKLELCKNLAAENRDLRNKAAEIDMERKHMEEQKALLTAEIAELRDENTKQAYEFAEQKKDIETQFLNENLRRAELMQLHTYHVGKTDELINEITKQFKLAKKSLEEMETKQ